MSYIYLKCQWVEWMLTFCGVPCTTPFIQKETINIYYSWNSRPNFDYYVSKYSEKYFASEYEI